MEYKIEDIDEIQNNYVVIGPSDGLACPICQAMLKDPVQTECGHRFCRGCLSKWIKEQQKNYDYDGMLKCPECRSEMPEDDYILVDRAHERMIQATKVKCGFCEEECEWRNWTDHLQSCSKMKRPCSFYEYGCRELLDNLVDLATHERESVHKHVSLMRLKFHKLLDKEIKRLKDHFHADLRVLDDRLMDTISDCREQLMDEFGELKDELKEEVKEEIKEDLKQELKNENVEAIKEELVDGFKSEIKEAAKSEVTDGIDEVATEIHNGFSSSVVGSHFASNEDDALQYNISNSSFCWFFFPNSLTFSGDPPTCYSPSFYLMGYNFVLSIQKRANGTGIFVHLCKGRYDATNKWPLNFANFSLQLNENQPRFLKFCQAKGSRLDQPTDINEGWGYYRFLQNALSENSPMRITLVWKWV